MSYSTLFLEKAFRLNKIPYSLILENTSFEKEYIKDFVKGILCLESKYLGCKECKSCKIFEKDYNIHQDFYYLNSNPIKIDDIRAIQDFIEKKPTLSSKKAVFIEKIEFLNKESANALLKTLEEPPFDTHIIMTTFLKNAILPTVLSRSIIIHFEKEKKNIPQNLISLVQDLFQKKESFYFKTLELDNIKDEEKLIILELIRNNILKEMKEKNTFIKKYDEVLNYLDLVEKGIPKGIRFSLSILNLENLLT